MGDLDGDGRDEVLVYVAEGDGLDYPLFVVPGSTPAGRHDTRSVGAQLPATTDQPVSGTGDLDGDGTGDLLLPRNDTELMVVRGTLFMDALGGAVANDVEPLVTPDAAGAGRITGFENGDGRHVQLAMPGTRSGTQRVFLWNLDDPCVGPSTAG